MAIRRSQKTFRPGQVVQYAPISIFEVYTDDMVGTAVYQIPIIDISRIVQVMLKDCFPLFISTALIFQYHD